MAMPGRLLTTKVWARVSIRGRARCCPKLLLNDAPGIGSLNTRHAIIHQGEVWPSNHPFDHLEVETFLQQCQVVLNAVKDFHNLSIACIVDRWAAKVKIGHVFADLELRDLCSPFHHFFGHLLGSWAAVLTIVFDAKIIVRASRVVRSRANKAAKGHKTIAAAANHSRCGRCGEESSCSAPDLANTVGESHFDDDLDCHIIPVTAIPGNHQGSTFNRNVQILQRVEDTLHIIVQVWIFYENLCLFAET
mmetsp:Transcript_58858/g.116589  ORF Transcript_58858/g.116589 Transcript_58858/m.116589 type:complete len:248 (-) Transcript_58858:56-799(-)